MGSKFGFGTSAGKASGLASNFLRGGIKLAQQEFKENFESESAAGDPWQDLSYRDVPPPILDLTGKLKSEATEKSPEISVNGFSGKAVLNINPTDERGREYADYHEQDSNGEDGTKGDGDYGRNVQREFVTQSDFLYAKQEALLVSLLDKLL